MTDRDRLRIGLVLPTWPLRGGGHASWPELRRLARDAEAMGVDTVWVPDHLQRRVRDRPAFGFWECWTILTATAEATSRIEVGSFVVSAGFRHPALLARMAATLDEVSGGRLVLGLGPGSPATDESWRAFGFDGERHVSRFAEAAEIVTGMLHRPPLTFEGDFYRVEGADLLPRPERAGRPPVWLAAKGDRTLAIAARLADAVNVNTPLASAEDGASIVAAATAACASVGRDRLTLDVTGWGRLSLQPDGTAAARTGWIGGSPQEVAGTLRAIHAAGVSHVTLYLGDVDDPSPTPALTAPVLERFTSFLEAIRAG